MCLINSCYQSLITRAFQLEKSSFMALLGYAHTVYSLIIDITHFHVEFNLIQILGGLVVLFFNILAIIIKIYQDEDKDEFKKIDSESK